MEEPKHLVISREFIDAFRQYQCYCEEYMNLNDHYDERHYAIDKKLDNQNWILDEMIRNAVLVD